MVLFQRSVLRLSSSGPSSLTSSCTPSARQAPHNLQFDHVLGSRRFSLFGEAVNNSKLLVQCTVPVMRSARQIRRRRVVGNSRAADEDVQVVFECVLSNICRGFPLALTLRCSTRAGLLVINGASFSATRPTLLEGPEIAQNQLSYHGPHMNQSHLADLLVERRPPTSPLDDPAHREATFFSTLDCFDTSPHTWFGHLPVHTVKPELVDRIAALVSEFGVDDDLADYVDWKARAVAALEQDAWARVSKGAFVVGVSR
ncbi:hypothetical protein NESM_000064300 [Novymonas esmeraldas]|uniref:Uncharacterized protein n=1 Tax=Novymonas esmeraldas TaxID=1808958 RepID=A0AAW0F0M3_9TRYP